MLGRRHLKNIALNISGMVLPMAAGLCVVPSLVHRLGTDRFGILSISWVLVGYFGLLDLGLARGLTQFLAQQTATGTPPETRAAVARKVRFWMLCMGLGWSTILISLTPWLTKTGLQMPAELHVETTVGWIFLALSIPFFMWSSSSIGVLEAYNRFPAVNAIRIPMGIATFLVPWAISLWTSNLGAVLAGLFVVRFVTALSSAYLSRVHFANSDGALATAHLKDILAFGGWLTVSNLVGPVLAYFDRFAIGALLSVTAVTHYTVPFDVLSRLPAIPVAMMGVFFPMLAQTRNNSGQLPRMVRAASQLLVGFWVPGLVVCALLGKLLLSWWVGADIAQASSGVWAWIATGVLVNGFAHIPYTLLHSAGRTDIPAKFHLIELIPYLVALWWGIEHYGITGAAAVWTIRVLVDTLLLYLGATRLFPELRAVCASTFVWAVGTSALIAVGLYAESAAKMAWTNPIAAVWLLLTALLWSSAYSYRLLKKQT